MQARAIFEAACDGGAEGRQGDPRDHDPAGRARRTSCATRRRIVRRVAEEVMAKQGVHGGVPGRHDDRGAARRGHRRPDRRGGRVLLVRHQRPHADHVRLLARRRGQVPARVRRAARCCPRDPFVSHRPGGRRRADASGRSSAAASARPSSRSASAASTAAIPRASSSATAPGSTTCRARRSACRSRGWPRRRPRCAARRRRATSASRRRGPGFMDVRRVAVVIPALDEAGALPAVLAQLPRGASAGVSSATWWWTTARATAPRRSRAPRAPRWCASRGAATARRVSPASRTCDATARGGRVPRRRRQRRSRRAPSAARVRSRPATPTW